MKYGMIEGAKMRLVYLLFNSVFFTNLQIFTLEVMLIRNQVWINVGASDPKCIVEG